MALDRTSTLAGRLAGRAFGDPHHAAAVVEAWLAEHPQDAVAALTEEALGADDPDLGR